MRLIARQFVAMTLAAGMVTLPAMAGVPGAGANGAPLGNGASSAAAPAANERPVGMIAMATNAHLDSAEAAMGANVYGGDALETSAGGTLRVKVGVGQLYLLGDSAATMSPAAGDAASGSANATSAGGAAGGARVRAKLTRGTIGFSAPSSDGIEIETAVGVVRAADGQPRAFGQVTARGTQSIMVTSYTGTLVVEREGEEHVIPEGKTYEVAVAQPNAEPQKYGVTPAHNDKLVLKLIVVGTAAVAGFFLWCAESVSDYHPPCN
jgi:hypothetical protein